MVWIEFEDSAIDNNEGRIWVYLFFSAVASTLGCTVILSDVIWNKLFPQHSFSILEGRGFLNRALSLSGGTLLTAALYKLLPQALGYIGTVVEDNKLQNAYLFVAFAIGLCLCWVLNAVIHLCTAKSVVHCAHDVEQDAGDGIEHSHSHGLDTANEDHTHSHDLTQNDQAHEHSHYHSHSVGREGSEHAPASTMSRRSLAHLVGCDENSRLLDESSLLLHHHAVHQHYSVPDGPEFTPAAPPMLLSATTRVLPCHDPGRCRGFSSIKQCSKDVHDSHCDCGDTTFSQSEDAYSGGAYYDPRDNECPEDQADPQLHHHHVTTTDGQIFSIGIQTAAAITLHKFPEGFLMYATNKADQDLGFQVFIALALHNFTEGFSIAAPLYIALRSRLKALIISAVLCGGSQPLGALAAKFLLRGKELEEGSTLQLGLLIAAVAGLMSTIALQMIAVPAFTGGTQRLVVSWTTLGVLFVLFVNCV